MKDFNKIVNKLWKKWWKVVFKKDIYEIIDPECKSEYQHTADKVIYNLRSREVLISLKAGVYIVPEKWDASLNKVDLWEKYFLQLLKKYIIEHCGSLYYISWNKSLEVHMKDFSIPDKIYIINRSINKKIKIWKKEIIFKTLSWNNEERKINLYSKFSHYIKIIRIDGIDFKFSGLELSLIESALVSDNQQGINLSLLIKAIKKYKTVFDYDIFYEVGKYKYNMAFNRLKEISRTIDTPLYQVCLEVIKRNGGCFVWEWLRGI
jgi:hypothetical protein